MEAAVTAELIKQAPGLAAALIIVVIFVAAQKEQNREWREFLAEERKSRALDTDRIMSVLDKLVQSCGMVHSDLGQLDTFLHTALDTMNKARNRRKDDPKQ